MNIQLQKSFTYKWLGSIQFVCWSDLGNQIFHVILLEDYGVVPDFKGAQLFFVFH